MATSLLTYRRPAFLHRLVRRLAERSALVGWCREWQGAKGRGGYGVTAAGNQHGRYVHRIAWELAHGPIPDGMRVLHHCDNPPCFQTEPDERYPEGHLFLGTNKDNTADMYAKGRAAPRTLYGNAKLTLEVRSMIRATHAGRGTLALAKSLGCSPQAIRDVRSGRTWSIDTEIVASSVELISAAETPAAPTRAPEADLFGD